MSGRLSGALAALMALQAASGLLVPGLYRDVEWIRASWVGNDWVTLCLGVPLLVFARHRAGRGSDRGTLLWLGLLGYGAYNYAFYMLGATLNAAFPLYVLGCTLSGTGLVSAVFRLRADETAARFDPATPVRAIGGYMVFVASGLALIWTGIWGAHVFAGRPTPVEPEAFRLVAALDLTLMVPALSIGGVLLWRRSPWGYVISAIAGTQASLYLTVLGLNSWIAISRGLAAAPGELPVWIPLALATTLTTAVLLRHAGARPSPPRETARARDTSVEGD